MILEFIIILFIIGYILDSSSSKNKHIGYREKPTTLRPTEKPKPQPK